ncbi:MAG TPA: sensor histidine kinase [Thermoanaerobaculia bacterium]|nr:sensor histidine kinase [Thermoanaerobaculia bacterium]
MTHSRLIGVAGLLAGLIVGVPALLYHLILPPAGTSRSPLLGVAWVAAFLLFGALFGLNFRRPRLSLLAAESAAAIAIVLLRCNGYEGTLLVLVAMQLGTRLGRNPGVLWICGQTLLLGAATAVGWSPRAALLLVPPYLGFQLVAFLVFHAMAREIAERASLAAANAELKAVQEILAESSRMAERLRIAHELHDALGHRLTALTLQLEAAVQRADGPTKANVERARSLAKGLLEDVRAIVADFRERDGAHFAQALRTLVGSVPRPAIHLDVAGDLRVTDPERAHVLLRCAQEIVTNAAKHSGAENLWIVVERRGEAFRIAAHDDGRGSRDGNGGFGLRGMRERIEKAGGHLHVTTEPGRGFDVSALVPAEGGVA